MVDFASHFGPVRDQGPRPTCVAFAISDLHATAIRTPATHLSPEYAYYHAAELEGSLPTPNGVTLEGIADAVSASGQPEEQHYPYLATHPATAPLPPPGKPFPHPTYRRAATIKKGSATHVIGLIRGKTPLLLVLRITDAFRRAEPSQPVVQHHKGDPVVGVHAVIAVGLAEDSAGQFLVKIRNSWGRGWGDAGHAWLTEEYLNATLVSYARM